MDEGIHPENAPHFLHKRGKKTRGKRRKATRGRRR